MDIICLIKNVFSIDLKKFQKLEFQTAIPHAFIISESKDLSTIFINFTRNEYKKCKL
jgi:hypothetical protein